jgi:hypothetical protein
MRGPSLQSVVVVFAAIFVVASFAARARADEPPAAATPAASSPATITVAAGTLVEFRFDEKVKARKSSAGEKIPATVAKPVVVGGVEVVKAGSEVTVVVAEARRKKAGYFRTAEGYLSLDVVGVAAVDGSQLLLESVTPIEVGTKEKKFTWTAGNASVKPDDTFLARVTRDAIVRKP